MRLNKLERADLASALAAAIAHTSQQAVDFELAGRDDAAERFRAIADRKRALLARVVAG